MPIKEQPKHAEFSASQSSQWLNCHGVMGMKALVPKEKSGDAANEGTAAHELLEICLNEGLDGYEMIDRSITITTDEDEEITYIVDDDMADAVQGCIDVVNSYIKDYPHAEIKVEQKVDISELCGEGMYGTVDVRIAIAYDRLIIIDYKHGRGVPVDAEDNTQLIYYALGSALEDDFEFETVEMVIVQPRCPQNADVQEYILPVEDVREWAVGFRMGRQRAEKARDEIIKAGKPISKYLKAGSWCKFCPAQGICPAKYDQMIKVAQMEFSEEDELMDLTKLDLLPMDKRLIILKHGDEIKKYIDKVHSDTHTMAENGHTIPGHKLVQKKSNAKFTDEEPIVIKKLVKAGFEEDEVTRTKIETLGSLRKTCGKDFIETLTYKPDTGTTLVPEKDKRVAVIPSAVSDFDD